MSQIIWQSVLIPDANAAAVDLYDPHYNRSIENLRYIPVKNEDIVIPDPKAFRSMNRAALLLTHLCWQTKAVLEPYLNRSAFSVGIYCATENGPIDGESAAKILQNSHLNSFAENYRKFRNPKIYLKQLPNLNPAHLAVAMGIQGPTYIYTHSSQASVQALEQAEWDLRDNFVDVALVCSVHALEDFLVIQRIRDRDDRCINEAVAAAVLIKNDQLTRWSDLCPEHNANNYYGVSDKLVHFLKEGIWDQRNQ